jgi:hypothetical protein
VEHERYEHTAGLLPFSTAPDEAGELAARIVQRLGSSSLAAVTASGIGDLVNRGGRELRSLVDRVLP